MLLRTEGANKKRDKRKEQKSAKPRKAPEQVSVTC